MCSSMRPATIDNGAAKGVRASVYKSAPQPLDRVDLTNRQLEIVPDRSERRVAIFTAVDFVEAN